MRIMSNTGRLDKKRDELEDLCANNAKQGQHLINSIHDHYACHNSHEQAWSDYGQLADKCNELNGKGGNGWKWGV